MSDGELMHWRAIIGDAHHLSRRFRQRHARILTELSRGCGAEQVEAAQRLAPINPRAAARLLTGSTPPASTHRTIVGWHGPEALVERAKSAVPASSELDAVVATCPRLERPWVPLHPTRQASRLCSAPKAALVVLRWSADSVADRERHRRAATQLAARVNAEPVTSRLHLSVPAEYAIAEMSEGDPWVFAPDYGLTLEDELREGNVPLNDRRCAVNTLLTLRRVMLEQGVVWQGFAPRNMFRRGDQLVLIDFEACATIEEDPARAVGYLQWHRVFFADCLTPDEHAAVFFDHPALRALPDDHQLKADAFERALLGIDKIDWAQRRALLSQSESMEGRHTRPGRGRDDGVLHGHELGHFWGDFVPAEVEAEIFRQLAAVQDQATIVACLEAFEAAMEADIDALLRSDARGVDDPRCARNTGLAEALSVFGAEALAQVRCGTGGWYDRLEDEPADLMDEVLFGLYQPENNQSSQYLIGTPDKRREHTASLNAAVRIGLEFLHGDGRDGRYLDYADDSELRQLLSEPLPVDAQEFSTVLEDVKERIGRYSISQAHHQYLAFPDVGNSVAAVAGSMLTRLLNQNLIAVDRSAPAATFATIQVIEWLRELVGYDTAPIAELRGVRDVAGLWTTGGHLSNHIAMLTALGTAFPAARKAGVRALDTQPAVVMAGPIAHYSHSDSAFHLGLGWDAVLKVDARPDYTTDPDAVDAILRNPPGGVTPFMVVGVAGNCRTTGLDDLRVLAEVCRRHGVWLHVDACHGGSLIFHDQLKEQCLGGLEHADSVSLDPHKGLFTPYPSSYVLFRQRGVLSQFSRHEVAVNADGCWDLGLITPFVGSCGFEALPTWMLLKHVGVRQLGSLVAARQALVRHLERRVDDVGIFVRLNDVDFYRLAFVFYPPQARAIVDAMQPSQRSRVGRIISQFTSRLNNQLYRGGRAGFDEHTLTDLDDRVGLGSAASYTIMGCCPGNPLTSRDELDQAVATLTDAARELLPDYLRVLTGGAEPAEIGRVHGPAGWSDT